MVRFQSKCFLCFVVCIVSTSVLVACRLTSPMASKPLQEPQNQMKASPSGTTPTSTIQSPEVLEQVAKRGVRPHRKAEIPAGFQPAIIQFVHIKQMLGIEGTADYGWSIDLLTGMEIWCESRCSEFKLFDQMLEGDRQLIAIKSPIVGRTSPGILNKHVDIKGKRSDASRVIIEHVGAKWNSVIVEDVMSIKRRDFYGLPMTLTFKKNKDGVGEFWGALNGKTVVLKFSEGVSPPELTTNSQEIVAFVFGGLEQPKNSALEPVKFEVTKILSPWAAE